MYVIEILCALGIHYELYNHTTISPFKGDKLMLSLFLGDELMLSPFKSDELMLSPFKGDELMIRPLKGDELKLFWEQLRSRVFCKVHR